MITGKIILSPNRIFWRFFYKIITLTPGQAVGGVFPALVGVFVTLLRVTEQNVGFACFTIATLVLVRLGSRVDVMITFFGDFWRKKTLAFSQKSML
jgi:hypothetical protein